MVSEMLWISAVVMENDIGLANFCGDFMDPVNCASDECFVRYVGLGHFQSWTWRTNFKTMPESYALCAGVYVLSVPLMTKWLVTIFRKPGSRQFLTCSVFWVRRYFGPLCLIFPVHCVHWTGWRSSGSISFCPSLQIFCWHHCLKSGNIPKTEGGQIYVKFVTVLWSSWNLSDTKKGFVGAKVFYREHALAYPQSQFYDLCWSWDFYLYHNFWEMWCRARSEGQELYTLKAHYQWVPLPSVETIWFHFQMWSVLNIVALCCSCDFLVGMLQMGFQDVTFLSSRASFTPRLSRIVVQIKSHHHHMS